MKKIKRRTVIKGIAATATMAGTTSAVAQFLLAPPPPPGPPPPPNTVDHVTVVNGSSQAIIQVVKPDISKVKTSLIGGNPSLADNSYAYYFDGVPGTWTLDQTGTRFAQATIDSVNANQWLITTQDQWRAQFQASPADAAGEIVSVIQVGASGDAHVPMTLAQVQALAPQLFVPFAPGQRPFNWLSSWNTGIKQKVFSGAAGATYTSIAWPASTGFNYFLAWDSFSPGVYVPLSTDSAVTVTVPASWGWPSGTVAVKLASTTFTLSGISGTTMTVTNVAGGPIQLGMIQLSGGGVTAGTRVVKQLTGTKGGPGTYEVSPSQTAGAATIVAGITGADGSDSEIIIVDGTTIWNFWQFHRTGVNTATANGYAHCDGVLDSGWGTASPFKGAGTQAVGCSLLCGLLVQSETDQGEIRHALHIRTDIKTTGNLVTGEAINSDGNSSASPLLVQEGWRLGIPASVVMPGGLSPLGQKIFRCLVKFGCFVTDTAGGVYGIRIDPLSYDATTVNLLYNDLAAMIPLLQRVT